jgi:hypothetical protein
LGVSIFEKFNPNALLVGLEAQLEKAKQLYPEKNDAAIAMSDHLPYERLIRGMDGFLKKGFPQIHSCIRGKL